MTQNNNKKIMLVLAAIFVLPVLLAKFALETDFFNKGATNKGNLLPEPLEFATVLKRDEPIWRLVFTLPESCAQTCKNSIYSINQIWQAIGREQDRVQATILYTQNSDAIVKAEIIEMENFAALPVTQEQLQSVFQSHSLADIYIADTLGNIILSYSITEDSEQAVMKSRDILADLKKLLKLSRIG
ncbi:MAG: hypothetical protein ACFHVJ_03995 [Aestuariibacter sp.]